MAVPAEKTVSAPGVNSQVGGPYKMALSQQNLPLTSRIIRRTLVSPVVRPAVIPPPGASNWISIDFYWIFIPFSNPNKNEFVTFVYSGLRPQRTREETEKRFVVFDFSFSLIFHSVFKSSENCIYNISYTYNGLLLRTNRLDSLYPRIVVPIVSYC